MNKLLLRLTIAVISARSLAFKASLLHGSSLYLSMLTLLAQALPYLLTITLLIRFHSGSVAAARTSGMNTSQLTRYIGGATRLDV
jgi:hypothetical protein